MKHKEVFGILALAALVVAGVVWAYKSEAAPIAGMTAMSPTPGLPTDAVSPSPTFSPTANSVIPSPATTAPTAAPTPVPSSFSIGSAGPGNAPIPALYIVAAGTFTSPWSPSICAQSHSILTTDATLDTEAEWEYPADKAYYARTASEWTAIDTYAVAICAGKAQPTVELCTYSVNGLQAGEATHVSDEQSATPVNPYSFDQQWIANYQRLIFMWDIPCNGTEAQ
jgi:hypothetical protein